MSLASRITDLAGAIRDKINQMMPRLLPSGGTTGQVLTRTSGGDYASAWQDATGGGGGGGASITVFTDETEFDGFVDGPDDIAVLDGPRSIVIATHYLMPQPSGTIIDAAVNALAATTMAGVALRCDFVPFIPGHDLTIDQMLIEVTTLAASTTMLIGIYSDQNGAPYQKLVESSALDGGTQGVKPFNLGTPFTLEAGGVYWLAVLTSGVTTLRALAVGGMYALNVYTAAGVRGNVRRATLASMELPAIAPDAPITGGTTPQFRMRVA